MAHDPRREDYQRLALRFVRTIDPQDPAAAREFTDFGRRFAQERDSLPQTDADRAFHLVCRATELIDYKLPFAEPDQAAELIRHGQSLLDEALSLDEKCFDALRMKSGPEVAGLDARHEFLVKREPEVRADCEQARDAQDPSEDEERVALGRALA
ncbi:MAG: response regulator receiver protein, partial [Paratractidigestivibacter faecalis]